MDYTVRVWNLETNALLQTFTPSEGGHTSQVTCLAKSPLGNFIVSGGMDCMLIVYDAATATPCYKGNQGSIIASVSCVATATDEGKPATRISLYLSRHLVSSIIVIDMFIVYMHSAALRRTGEWKHHYSNQSRRFLLRSYHRPPRDGALQCGPTNPAPSE
jgi:hypothetical protein